MEAILLVGGLGTRLRPLTENTAKPLLMVAGAPLVVHQLAKLAAAGVEHVVLATSYRAETFAAALGDGSRLGLRIDYAVEAEPLGTGGAIRHAATYLTGGPDAPVLVLNGDIIDGHDITAQVARHQRAQADVTLYLTRVEDARAFGCVPTDGDRVRAFLEKMDEPVSDQVNAGCYVFRREVIDTIPPGSVVSVERETFPALLAAGRRVIGVVDDSYWRDVGTPEAYVQVGADLVRGVVDSPARVGPPGEFLLLDGAETHVSATLQGGSCVASGARVGADAVLDGTVVLDDAIIGDGARVTASAIGAWASIGSGAVLDRVVVADGVDVPPGATPAPGSRLT